MSDEGLIREMVSEPRLVKRPIVTTDRAHVVGAKKSDLERLVDEIQDIQR